jgi:hypothetical protein
MPHVVVGGRVSLAMTSGSTITERNRFARASATK